MISFITSGDIIGGDTDKFPGSNNPDSNLISSIPSIAATLIVIAGIVMVFMLIFGGFKYLTAQGDDKKTDEARKTIRNAIIGLVLVLLAWSIYNVVSTFLLDFGN